MVKPLSKFAVWLRRLNFAPGINLKNIFLEIILCMSLYNFNPGHISVFYMSFSSVYVLLWLCYAFVEGAFAEGEQVHV